MDLPAEELPQYAKVDDLCEGLKAWTNPQNAYRVLRLHMFADPAKRSEAYQKEAAGGMPLDKYLREFHLVWRSFEGRPVYQDEWNRLKHVAPDFLNFAPHLPVIRGWDFGLTPACVFAQLMPNMRLFVLREICEEEMGLERFLDQVKARSLEWFPTCKKWFDVIDPAGFQRSQTDERSCMHIMSSSPHFLSPVPGLQNPVKRRNSVVEFLQRAVHGDMAFQISPACKTIINGFDGGYHYAKRRDGSLREVPEKNIYSHPHDALQYITTKIFDLNLNDAPPPVIKQPGYSFNKGAALKRTA